MQIHVNPSVNIGAENPEDSDRRRKGQEGAHTMIRRHPTPRRESMVRLATTFKRRERRGLHGRSAWVALGALALAMVLGLGASPVAALSSPPPAGFGGSSGVSRGNQAIFPDDLDAAQRLTGLGQHYIDQHALADADAAFRGALPLVAAARSPTDPRLADSRTAPADLRTQPPAPAAAG